MLKQLVKNKKFLPYSRQNIDKKDIDRVVKVLKSNFITQGPEIENFEKSFAKYVGAKYAVACATGTAALHLSCMALNISSKSNVITSSITFAASANCAEFVGARVEFLDIDSETYCMSAKSLEEKLKKKKIDLVIPVHMCGHSADMKKIYQLKKKYKFNIIEDSCHGLGGKYNGHKIGSCKFSDISTFSFHPVKPITTGEGGMITTNNNKIFKKLKLLRTHGIHRNPDQFINKKMAFDELNQPNRWYYEMSHLGYNYRMTDIQAALGNSQLTKLEKFTKKRNEIAKYYIHKLKYNSLITLPVTKKNVLHSFHLFTILIDFKKIKKTRNQVMKELANFNIGSQVLYIPVYHQPYYKKKYNYNPKNFPNSLKYYSEALSIPIFFELKKTEHDFIIKKINEIVNC
jgi:UDP-4-amino-4,6-dideoxy-N-acetyl-beta-L-altrosamine transaminase